MSWKKHFRPVKSILPPAVNNSGPGGMSSRFSSWLPEYYQGPPNRLARYAQYDQMDMDHEIAAALDTLADFSTRLDIGTNLPFEIVYHEEASPSENEVIRKTLRQWCNLNEMDRRLFRLFRNILKYGDQFFVRDPETYKLLWIDPATVEKVLVNESDGKRPEAYYVRDLDLNFESLVATNVHRNGDGSGGNGIFPGVPLSTQTGARYTQTSTPGADSTPPALPVDANHIVHFSLSEGMTSSWPFGTSILENVFKVYKQKELLEDSVLIYRIHRAPERRVFYIDVGTMPPNKAAQYLERVRYEVQQKRIPSRTGGGESITDAAYNPMSFLEDYFFATTAEGRGSKVETLPGGENLGQIDDLRYFNNKLMRGLGVPSGYLPTGPEDGSAAYTDGRVGGAFIQEFRFSNVCRRYQKLIAPVLDREFKLYLKKKGITIDSGMFELVFQEPQSFSEYRQLELDSARSSLFGNVSGIEFMSKRFALKKYLGLTDDEIAENERLWREENGLQVAAGDAAESDFRSAGVGGFAGADFDDGGDFGGDDDFGVGDLGDDDFSGDEPADLPEE